MTEQFAVRDSGEHKDVRRFVSAQEAGRAFHHYTSSIGSQQGSTVRVIVIDRNDCIVREWMPFGWAKSIGRRARPFCVEPYCRDFKLPDGGRPTT